MGGKATPGDSREVTEAGQIQWTGPVFQRAWAARGSGKLTGPKAWLFPGQCLDEILWDASSEVPAVSVVSIRISMGLGVRQSVHGLYLKLSNWSWCRDSTIEIAGWAMREKKASGNALSLLSSSSNGLLGSVRRRCGHLFSAAHLSRTRSSDRKARWVAERAANVACSTAAAHRVKGSGSSGKPALPLLRLTQMPFHTLLATAE